MAQLPLYVFSCEKCAKTFKIKGTMTRHQKSCQLLAPKIMTTESDPLFVWGMAHITAQATAPTPRGHGEKEPVLTAATLHEVLMYKNTLNMEHLSEALFTQNFDEFLDEYLIGLKALKTKTICNQLRHLRWCIRWQMSLGLATMDDLDSMDCLVRKMQTRSSLHSIQSNALNVLDPYALITIRERVVDALRLEQSRLDTFIENFLIFGTPVINGVHLSTFALELRNWLELVMRFTSIPLRIQCSQFMVVPSHETSDYICKLVYDPFTCTYSRIVNRDKTQTTHQPLSIPVGFHIDPYMAFYMRECRPLLNPRVPYVFVSKRGKTWTRASRNLKNYLVRLGIQPDQIEESGRFLHGARKIALASFAIRVNFDIMKLRGLAKLMRHSIEVSERYYSTWMNMYLSQQATHVWAEEMNGQVLTQDRPRYAPGRLNDPPPALISYLRPHVLELHTIRELPVPPVQETHSPPVPPAQETHGPPVPPVQETHSPPVPPVPIHQSVVGGTRTFAEAVPEKKVPNCATHNTCLSVHGPVGAKRAKTYGRYFLQCAVCFPDHRPRPNSLYYPIGYTPPVESKNAKPRNMALIASYVDDSMEKGQEPVTGANNFVGIL